MLPREKIRVRLAICQAVLAHTRALLPLEACGLLAAEGGTVRHLYAIENELASPTAYRMKARQQVEAMLHAEAQGWTLQAVYHSHPTGPTGPSVRDVVEWAYPELALLIVSWQGGRRPCMRAFQWDNGHFHEIRLEMV